MRTSVRRLRAGFAQPLNLQPANFDDAAAPVDEDLLAAIRMVMEREDFTRDIFICPYEVADGSRKASSVRYGKRIDAQIVFQTRHQDSER